MFEGGFSGVAEPEAAHDHIQLLFREGFLGSGQTEMGQGNLHFREEGGHEVLAIENDLDDIQTFESKNRPAAQNQLAQRRVTIVEFFVEWR